MCGVELLHVDVVQVAWQWLSNCICSHPTHHQLEFVYSGGLSVRCWGLHVWIVCNEVVDRHINSPVTRMELCVFMRQTQPGEFTRGVFFMGPNWWTWGVYNKYTYWKVWHHFARVWSDNLGWHYKHKGMELYNHLSHICRWTETPTQRKKGQKFQQ